MDTKLNNLENFLVDQIEENESALEMDLCEELYSIKILLYNEQDVASRVFSKINSIGQIKKWNNFFIFCADWKLKK